MRLLLATVGSLLIAAPVVAATLPSKEQVAAQAAKCRIPTDRVGWEPGERGIVTVYIDNDPVAPDVDADRKAGACFEAWAKTLGLKPVVIVNIPEDH